MAKEYTTSQALAMLDEDMRLTFIRPNYDILYISLDGNYNILRKQQIIGVMLGDCNMHTMWKLVQKPMDIKQAAEAFKQGKNIRCEYLDYGDNKLTQTDHFVHDGSRSDCMCEDSPEITFYMINEGKWYIDEEEE